MYIHLISIINLGETRLCNSDRFSVYDALTLVKNKEITFDSGLEK